MNLSFIQLDSPIHSMNALAVFTWVLAVSISVLFFSNPFFLFALMLSTLFVVIVSKTLMQWFSFLKFFVFLSLLIVLINSFASQYGSTFIFSLPVSVESIAFGLTMAFRLLIIISAFAVFTFTVNPDKLFNSFSQTKLPFKFLLVLLLSLRFLPILSIEAKNIKDAQRVRGVSFNGGILDRARKSFLLLLPMFFVSMEKAVSLSESMESRAFGSGKRSFYNSNKLDFFDFSVIISSVFLVLFSFFLILNNIGTFSFYPFLSSLNFSSIELFSLFFVFLLSSFILIISKVKK